MSALDVTSRPVAVREIRLELHPFMPLYRELPSATCGYVYLLASIANSRKCYVGETDNLKKCLREHNTGYGAEDTRPTELHPWGVFAFVCGFERDDPQEGIQRRKDFLSQVETRLDIHRGPEAVYSRLLDVVTDCVARGEKELVIVKCGEVR
jgi:hypothetical protein